MRRFRLLLLNELKLARNSIPVHLVAFLAPCLLFVLMLFVLVHPTWEVNMTQPATKEGQALLEAMRLVGPPVGDRYIKPVLVSSAELGNQRQVITVEERDDVPTAVQRYGLIDNNQVKNLRNRLTASALRVWNQDLGGKAVGVVEQPWIPFDLPFAVYFGMALLPYAAFIAAAVIGGVLTAQDFEFETIMEYRLSPVSPVEILGARMVRLVLSSLLAICLLLTVVALRTGLWPGHLLRLGWVLLLTALVASSFGVIVGLLIRRSFPAYIIGLILALAAWIFGDALTLSSGIGGVYYQISQLTPNHHAVELLFPLYYGVDIGDPLASTTVLAAFGLAMFMAMVFVYRRCVIRQG